MRKHFNQLFLLLLCFCLGTSLLQAQNKDSLISAYQEASLSRNANKIHSLSKELGNLFLKVGDEDSALYYFKETQKHSKTTIEKAESYFLLAKTTLFSNPAYSMNTAKKGFELVKDSTCIERTNLCNAIGIYYSLNGKYDSSLYYYTIGLTTSQKLKDEVMINKIKGNLGDLYSYMGDNASALKYQLEVLSHAEQIKDSSSIIRYMVNVGNTYVYMHKEIEGLDFFMKAYPSLKNKNSRLAGNLFNSIALAYEGLAAREKEGSSKWNEFTLAQKSFLEQSLSVKTNLKDSLGIANTLLNFGRLEYKLKNFTSAENYFNRSNLIGEKINNQRLIRNVSMELGVFYRSQKQYTKALPYFFKMYDLGNRDHDLASKHDALQDIYKTYELMGDYKNAFVYLSLYKEVIQQIDSLESAGQMAESEAKYKNEENKRLNQSLLFENNLKTIQNEKAENEKNIILVFSIIALLGAGLIFFLVFRTSSIKAKAKEEQEVTKAIFESEQKERIRISRDLHDNVGTQLSLISNDIEWITHPLKTFTENEKAEKLESIGNASKEVINTLRETIWALNKEEVSFEEFADKLKIHVQKQIKLSKNVKPSFTENLESNILLGPSEALALFRICQEAIANSLKYANAETLDISLNAQDGKYALIIGDKGKGFDQNNVERKEHFGIENMKFRAAEIACKLEIDSSGSNGTRIIVTKI